MLSRSPSPDLPSPPPEEYKIAFIGDNGSGKSSVVRRICYDFFDENHPQDPKISQIYRKELYLDGKECVLALMDTTDQGEGSFHTEKWIEESDAVVIVYNVSKLPWRSTPLKMIRRFHEMVRVARSRTSASFEGFPILVLGTMRDRVEERVLEARQGESLANELGCMFAECSALEGEVEGPIYELVKVIRGERGEVAKSTEAATQEEEPRKRSLHKMLDQLEEVSQKAWVFG